MLNTFKINQINNVITFTISGELLTFMRENNNFTFSGTGKIFKTIAAANVSFDMPITQTTTVFNEFDPILHFPLYVISEKYVPGGWGYISRLNKTYEFPNEMTYTAQCSSEEKAAYLALWLGVNMYLLKEKVEDRLAQFKMIRIKVERESSRCDCPICRRDRGY